MRVLNLYAGVGGNRWLWGDDHDITAVEYKPEIAEVYQEFFPNDTVVVADAHQYLLEHFKEFDFIWSSPPCPSHSRTSTSLSGYGLYRFPDMKLYEEIIFLQQFYKGNWVIENVIPYYKPLIRPVAELDRHLFWSNRHINKYYGQRLYSGAVTDLSITQLSTFYGITLPKLTINKRKLLRNAVDPKLGLHVFNAVGFRNSETVTGENLSLALASPTAPSPNTEEEKKK